MRRIALLGLLLLVAALGFAQQPIYYNSTPTLKWTPAGVAPDGSAFLPGDTVEYRIYVFDASLGEIALQPVANLALVATFIDLDPTTADVNGEESQQINLFPRVEYTAALFATHIDGGGNRTDYDVADTLYSTIAGDTASGIPFAYIPNPETPLPGPGPDNLRDSGM